MIRNKVYITQEPEFNLKHFEQRVEPKTLVMVRPKSLDFSFVDKQEDEVEISVRCNQFLAFEQWEELRSIYKWLADKEFIYDVQDVNLESINENQCLALHNFFTWYNKQGKRSFVMSYFSDEFRNEDINKLQVFFQQGEYDRVILDQSPLFQGSADLIPHRGKRLLYAGFTSMSEKLAFDQITHEINTPIFGLEIIDSRISHLSQCFLQIDEENVLIYSHAFSEESKKIIHQMFKRVIAIPEEEVFNFSLHADLFEKDGKKIALLPLGNSLTKKVLRKFDFDIININFSEFIKFGYGPKSLRNFIY